MTSPFSKDYKSQLDLADLDLERKRAKNRKETLAKRKAAGDPNAIGTIKGLSKKADARLWPKNKPLNQPPKNAQAKLQTEPENKIAKLIRGRAI
jgi:hypothetical protein